MLSHIIKLIKDEFYKQENKELINEILNPFVENIKNSYYLIIILQLFTIFFLLFFYLSNTTL